MLHGLEPGNPAQTVILIKIIAGMAKLIKLNRQKDYRKKKIHYLNQGHS